MGSPAAAKPPLTQTQVILPEAVLLFKWLFRVHLPPFRSIVFYLPFVSLKLLLRSQPKEALHVLDVPDEGAHVSPDRFAFAGEAVPGLPAVSPEQRLTGRAAAHELGRAAPASAAARAGKTSRPGANRRADDHGEEHDAAEQEAEVCGC